MADDKFLKDTLTKDIKNNEKESKWLHDLSIQIAYDKSIIDIENYVKSKPNFSKAKGFEDQFNLLLGAFSR